MGRGSLGTFMAGKAKRPAFDPWLIPPSAPEESPVIEGPVTVSQITASIKQAISRSLPSTVHVLGQVSNLKRHTSGHLYFTLKDPHSELPCVMWRSDTSRLKFEPDDGLEVVASGAIEIFDKAGRYQLYVRKLEPRGVGSLELAFRQLYERLIVEGLFNEARKRKLPRFPRRIAIVTSPTGAAIADILRTLGRRFPCVPIFVSPVRVQGDGAAGEIASAIRLVSAKAQDMGIDVLIVGRGGGSLEDLWAFNEELVARAIFDCTIPVISGVGHEVDTTIADLVADARAATPTAAAQMAVPVLDDVLQSLGGIQLRMERGVRVRWDAADFKAMALAKRSPIRDPFMLVRNRTQSIDLLSHQLHRNQVKKLGVCRARLERVERIIHRIAPHSVMANLTSRLARLDRVMRDSFQKKTSVRARKVEAASGRLERSAPSGAVIAATQRFANEHRRLAAGHDRLLMELAARLKSATGLLQAVSHNSVLTRGYSITRRKGDRKIVRSVADVQLGDPIVTQLTDGEINSIVE